MKRTISHGHHEASYWRGREEEARTQAEGMYDTVARTMMLQVAEMYHRLAEWADKRKTRRKSAG
jgi:hypothetical protein